jgi:hypothetical protein
MQFNFVVSATSEPFVYGSRSALKIVGRLPVAFRHPSKGFVDALVMFKTL